MPFGVPVPARRNFEVSKKRNQSFSTPSRFPQLVGISHSIIVLSSIIATIVIATLCRHHPQHHLHQVMIQTLNHLMMTIKKKSKRQNQQPKCCQFNSTMGGKDLRVLFGMAIGCHTHNLPDHNDPPFSKSKAYHSEVKPDSATLKLEVEQ